MTSPLSAEVIQEKLITALKKVNSLDIKGLKEFENIYKKPFTDLYFQVGKQARSRNEFNNNALRDELELAWKNVFSSEECPKIPLLKKSIEIFPGTSFNDALKLLEKHKDERPDIVAILKYIQTQLEGTKGVGKKLKTAISSLETTMEYHKDFSPIKSSCENLILLCKKLLTQEATEAAIQKQVKVRQQARLSKIPSPNGAEKRAAINIATKLDEMNGSSKSPGKGNKNSSSSSSSIKNSKTVTKLNSKSTATTTTTTTTTSKSPSKPGEKQQPVKRKMTDEEWAENFLKKARHSNMQREHEEEYSRYIGAKEDYEARHNLL